VEGEQRGAGRGGHAASLARAAPISCFWSKADVWARLRSQFVILETQGTELRGFRCPFKVTVVTLDAWSLRNTLASPSDKWGRRYG
jgi:hypothetical protein